MLGLAFLIGGLRHGTQTFHAPSVRTLATLLAPGRRRAGDPHAGDDARRARRGPPGRPERDRLDRPARGLRRVHPVTHSAGAGGPAEKCAIPPDAPAWPLPLAFGVLVVGAAGAALTSDLFVESLRPTMASLGLSEAFVGLVVVAIAGNAVENLVGVQAAAANKTDLATSLILNSSLQVAIALTPALVLISLVLGTGALTLVLTPAPGRRRRPRGAPRPGHRVRRREHLARGTRAARPLRDHRGERLVRAADPALRTGAFPQSRRAVAMSSLTRRVKDPPISKAGRLAKILRRSRPSPAPSLTARDSSRLEHIGMSGLGDSISEGFDSIVLGLLTVDDAEVVDDCVTNHRCRQPALSFARPCTT